LADERETSLDDRLRAGVNENIVSMAAANYGQLMEERNGFVHRQLAGAVLTEIEERRLAFIRWQLDRFEEAKLAPDFRQFEIAISAQERLAGSIDQLLGELQRSYPGTLQRAKVR
jgi:hypothetical protein